MIRPSAIEMAYRPLKFDRITHSNGSHRRKLSARDERSMPLASLTSLQVLYLGEPTISDLSPLAELDGLEYLEISGTKSATLCRSPS